MKMLRGKAYDTTAKLMGNLTTRRRSLDLYFPIGELYRKPLDYIQDLSDTIGTDLQVEGRRIGYDSKYDPQ